MSKHTKGPWEILTLDGKIPAIRKIPSSVGEADKFSATIKVADTGPPFEIVCVLDFGYGKSEDEANARLIASAPELLEEVGGLKESLEEIREWAQSTALKARHSEVLLVVELMCDNALAAEIK